MQLSQTLRLDCRQALLQTLEQKQEMLQTCLQQCVQTLGHLRDEIGLNPHPLGKAIFDAVALIAENQVRDPQVREALQQVLRDEANQQYLLDRAGRVAEVMERSFFDFAGEILIDSFETNSEGKLYLPGETEARRTSRGRAVAALVDPEKTREKLEQLRGLAQQMRDQDIQGLVQDIGELNDALAVAEYVKPYQSVVSSVLGLGFRIKDSNSQPILRNFFREAAVLRQLDWELSERIVKRFVARFISLKPSSASYAYADAMVNTIGEFTMVSLGILDPQLFRRFRGEVQELDVLFADQNVDDATNGAKSVVEQMRKLSLQESGVIYWCRWAIPGTRLSVHTDEAVRKLLRCVIGRDSKRILEAMHYEDFIADLREIRRENDREDAIPHFGERLTETLRDDEFREFLVQRCVQDWYPALKHFLRRAGRGQSGE